MGSLALPGTSMIGSKGLIERIREKRLEGRHLYETVFDKEDGDEWTEAMH